MHFTIDSEKQCSTIYLMNTFNALYMALSGITDFMQFLELKNKSITYKVYGTSLQIDAIIKKIC